MMKKRVYLWMVALLLIGTTACGKDTTEEATTQEQTEVTTEEVAEEDSSEAETTEATTTEVVATEAETTEAATEEAAAEETTEAAQSAGAITPEEAQKLIEETLGTEDEATGNTYSFAHVNTMTVNDVEYHVFIWNWLVDGHASHLTDLFVQTDGSAIYEGIFVGDGATVYTETNFLEK